MDQPPHSRWSRIEALFGEASRQAPSERSAFLHASEPDPGIRAEVERLLRAVRGALSEAGALRRRWILALSLQAVVAALVLGAVLRGVDDLRSSPDGAGSRASEERVGPAVDAIRPGDDLDFDGMRAKGG